MGKCYMRYQIEISDSNHTFDVIFKRENLNTSATTSLHHKHLYSELHIITEGSANYLIHGKNHTLNTGDAVLIPAGCYHNCYHCSKNTKCVYFQISKPDFALQFVHVPETYIRSLVASFEQFCQTGNCRNYQAMLTLICSHVAQTPEPKAKLVTNREYLIDEFFSTHYNTDIRIGKLAQLLNLSEKQTLRLVKKHTGHTYRGEIVKRRMDAAKMLIRTTNMTLEEIAFAVGYRSYNGFYKAFNNK